MNPSADRSHGPRAGSSVSLRPRMSRKLPPATGGSNLRSRCLRAGRELAYLEEDVQRRGPAAGVLPRQGAARPFDTYKICALSRSPALRQAPSAGVRFAMAINSAAATKGETYATASL
jgi:hypothetical protein